MKTALHGADPNWGRIAQALGQALPGMAPLAFDIAIEGIMVAAGGVAVAHDEAALQAAAAGLEIEYEVSLDPADPDGRGVRGLLLRPQPRVRDDQRGVHDVA